VKLNSRSWEGISGLLLLVGSVQFFFGLLVAEAIYPSYQGWQTISDLGVASSSPTAAIIFNSSLVLEGVLVVLAAFCPYGAYHRIVVSMFFGLGGIGAVGGALFPEDVHPTHLEISVFSFLIAGLTPFIALKVQRKPFSYVSVLLGAISFTAALLLSQNYTFGLAYGTMERFVAYPTLLWAIAFGGYLMNHPRDVNSINWTEME
jgi:hypothetical membrane protein